MSRPLAGPSIGQDVLRAQTSATCAPWARLVTQDPGKGRSTPSAADCRVASERRSSTQSGPSACLPGYPRLRSGSRRLWREGSIEQHLLAWTERLGHRCRYERILRIPITGDIVVERRGQISLQLRVGASYLGMVAQIVTKQKTVLPPG